MNFLRFITGTMLITIACMPLSAQAKKENTQPAINITSSAQPLLANISTWFTQQAHTIGQSASKSIHALLGGIASVARNVKQSHTAQAETVFYKEDGSPICEKEHEIIYDIKLHYQFPMSTLYNNYHDNEIAAMQQQLAEKLPGIKVAFIPTTMYELFFMNYIDHNQTTIKKASGGLLYNTYPHYQSYFNRGEPALTTSLEKTFLDQTALPFEEINRTLEVKKCHLFLNNYIVDFLKKRSLNPSTAHQHDYMKIHSDTDFKQSAYQEYCQHSKIDSLDKDHLEKILTTEYDAEKKAQWLLYRGTSWYDTKPTNAEISLSFGNSLFAGYRFDTGATAYFHMCKQRIGYLLPLSKKEYVDGKLGNMFHIPLLTTLAGAVARGEFFHPRSKITNPSHRYYGFAVANSTQVPSFYTIDGNILQRALTYRTIFNYIQQHRITIKGEHLLSEGKTNREPLYDLSTHA